MEIQAAAARRKSPPVIFRGLPQGRFFRFGLGLSTQVGRTDAIVPRCESAGRPQPLDYGLRGSMFVSVLSRDRKWWYSAASACEG